MTIFGYFLSSEEHSPKELIRQAVLAERAGFEALWISDHYHPWIDEQGQSSFVWSVIGALSEAVSLPVTTAVTCPLVRMHPAVAAQAAATAQILLDGRFRFGVGTGEALNEHVVGHAWPPAHDRRSMLEEAIEIIRELWSGRLTTYHGEFYDVETARLYSLPEQPPPIYVSGLGAKSAEMAGRIGDGYISTMPDQELLDVFHKSGGAGKPTAGGLKVCWGTDEEEARATAHRLWPTSAITGEASQLLPQPRHFEELARLVTPESLTLPCGPDPEDHLQGIQEYVDAGFDEIYIAQIGPQQEEFFEFYSTVVLPQLR
ncbi:LLM class F420-dependent oxidoreductase [Acrocarpospora phusangensis]|uniref:LLM class F420-dependent oxidoreductase n=1 Tax=Acrocarpospora phusangensis TaxID=1070424 RepID=A0A919QGM9_9ACTN|nr:TIGR03557 family F420-dependent LLM class oxidoreductase [Acrocarpospora phusangensis]GIH27208.1 LLM class F420-dependent oxidoreductase [Acrocarpospora phusangensis]